MGDTTFRIGGSARPEGSGHFGPGYGSGVSRRSGTGHGCAGSACGGHTTSKSKNGSWDKAELVELVPGGSSVPAAAGLVKLSM
eukprot:6489776-Amphidinium_carterae.1